MTFDDYLDLRLKSVFRGRPKGHPGMQDFSSFVCDWKGRLVVDQVLRFEELDSEFPKLCHQLGLPTQSLPRKRVTQGRGRSISEEYSKPETVEKVLQLYHRDFDRFGYSRDLPKQQELG